MAGSSPFVEIRDPIHDFISLSEDEIRIVNSEPFQRLRRIRQLAFTYLVYPGALHTRYEHSIGTCHVASRISAKLNMSEADRRRVRYAALLHDIGHLPFSHLGEMMVERASPSAAGAGSKKDLHELLSHEIIREVDEISKVLDGPNGPGAEEVISLLAGTTRAQNSGISLGSGIISGQIDADKMDYLMRDCHYTGVKYGIYDLDRLLNTICKANDPGRFAFEEGAVPALEQMILARFFMHEQVYMHKTRVVADAMAIRAGLLHVALDKDDGSHDLLDFARMKGDLAEFLTLDDESLTRHIMQSSSEDARTLMAGLRNRRLLHSVVKLPIDEQHFPSEKLRMKIAGSSKSYDLLAKIEKEFADSLELSPGRTIVNIQSLKAPTIPAPDKGIDSDDILIVNDEDRTVKPMSEYAHVLKVTGEKVPRKEILYVHAEIPEWDDRDYRKKTEEKSKALIQQILEGEMG